MKIEEMSTKASYIVCPDNDCELFYEEDHRCEKSCPHLEKIERVMRCGVCDNLFEIILNHSALYRLHHTCPDGRTPLIVGGTPVVTTRDIIQNYEKRLIRIKEDERWKHQE
jgi:hypothetical protein